MKYVVLFISLLASITLFAEGQDALTNADVQKVDGSEKPSKKVAAAATNETIVFERILLPVATNTIAETNAVWIIEKTAKLAEAQAERADERILVQCCAEQRALEPLLKELGSIMTNSTTTVTLGQGLQHLMVTISTPVATNKQEMRTISVFLRDGEVVDRFRDAAEYTMIGIIILTNNANIDAPLMQYTVRGKDIPVVESKDNWWKYFSAATKAATSAMSAQVEGEKKVEPQKIIYIYATRIQFKDRDAVLSTSAIFYPASVANTINMDSAALSIAHSNKTEELKKASSSLKNADTDAALKYFATAEKFQALYDTLKKNENVIMESRSPETISRISASIQNRTTEHFNFGLAYAIKDEDQLTYEKDNGIVTAKEDSKTPAFLTINYFPGGVEKRIKDADLDKSLPAPLWTPFHLMAGFRTDITDRFEPMMGAGVGIRVLEASLNVWAGVSLQNAQELKSGVEEGAAAPNGGITDDRYDMPFMWGVSISWKP